MQINSICYVVVEIKKKINKKFNLISEKKKKKILLSSSFSKSMARRGNLKLFSSLKKKAIKHESIKWVENESLHSYC